MIELSKPAEKQKAFYNYMMTMEEAYKPEDNNEVMLHDLVRGAVEEIFPCISQKEDGCSGATTRKGKTFNCKKRCIWKQYMRSQIH